MLRTSFFVHTLRSPLGRASAAVAALLLVAGCASTPAAPKDASGEEAPSTAASASVDAAAPDAAAPDAPAAEGSPVTPERLRETLAAASNAGAGAGGAGVLDPEKDETAVTGWLDDPETGRRYYLARLPLDVVYRRLPDGTVRTRYGGIAVTIDSEDADWIYYRVYDYSDVETRPFRPRMSEEDKAAVAASYAFDATSADRLRFEPFGEGLPAHGQWRQGFELADVNGDGHLDIVHGPPRKQHGAGPVVFLGDGAGGWRRWNATYPAMRYDYGDVAVGDFDGDGRPDIALAMHLLGTIALVQREPGVFVLWSEGIDYRPPADAAGVLGYTARTIAAADWNGDGRDDLVALGEGPKMAMGTEPVFGGEESYGAVVYRNEGEGRWRRIDRGTGRDHLFGDDLELVDLDGDGRLDFVTGTSATSRHDLLHLGDGDTWRVEEIDVRPRARVPAVASGDFDGDGQIDVAVGYLAYEGEVWRAGVDVFLRRDDGWSRRAVWNAESRQGVTALDAGDLDGDGRLDLVALSNDGRLTAWRGDGKGGFVADPSDEVTVLPGCAGFHVEIRDLDGDGRGDVVAAFAGEAGSEVIFQPSAAPERCPTQGALVAHRSAPNATP